MKTISMINLKGGVGKTVTAINTAAILAGELGRRVLVIDADHQANATRFFGLGSDVNSLAGIMAGLADDPYDFIYETSVEGVSCVPSETGLAELDIPSVREGVNVRALRGFCEVLAEDCEAAREAGADASFDVVIIDCPPNFTTASIAAICASDEVVIPVKIDAFALEGMAELVRQVESVRRIRPAVRIAGALVTMWHNSPAVIQGEELLRKSGLPVFQTRIRRSDKVDESTFMRQALRQYSSRSAAGRDYLAFVRELSEVCDV